MRSGVSDLAPRAGRRAAPTPARDPHGGSAGVPVGRGPDMAAGVGVRTPLIDGVDKVTGRARYTADLPLGPALVGRILRSPVAHG